MSSTTPIYEWKIYCSTENAFISYFGSTAPDKCPNDTSHTVSSSTGSVSQIRLIGPNYVIATDPTPDRAFYQYTTIPLDVPANKEPQILSTTFSYPFDMYIWEMAIAQGSMCIGDKLSVQIGPDTILGLLTSDLNTGTTGMSCTTTVTNKVARGCEIGITNGVTKEYLGRVLSYSDGQVVFSTPSSNYYPVGSYVLWSVYPIKDMIIDSTERLVIGAKGLKTKLVPANTPIKIIYQDNTIYPQSSVAYIHIQYYRL